MPQVPTIDEPSVQETPGQEVPFQAPPAQAFPGAVGASVEAVGAEIGRIAYEEQQKAASDEAIKTETEYQNFVLDTHSNFTQLHGEDVLKAYPIAKSGLRDKRLEMAGGMRSRTAQRLFMNSSLRTWRIYESQIDGHTAIERRNISTRERVNYINAKSTSLGVLAGSDLGLDTKSVADTVQQVYAKAEETADDAGVPELDRPDFIQKMLTAPIDSYMRNLVKGPNSAYAKEEFEKYKGLMTPAAQAEVGRLVAAQGMRRQAATILQKADRVSADPRYEPASNGLISQDSVEKMLQEAKRPDGTALTDGEKADLRHEVERQRVDLKKEYDDTVLEYEGRVVAAGSKGHAFIINRAESGADLEWLRINAPLRNAALEKQSRDNGDYELRGSSRGDKKASQRAFLAFQDHVLRMRDEEPAKFAALRERDSLGLGMDPPDQHRAWVMVQKYQKPDVVKLAGGSLRSQIVDKLDSIYERNTAAKDHARRYLLNKATLMDFKSQAEFDTWINSEFEQSGTWFKSYRVEQEIDQEEAAINAATPAPTAAAQGPTQKTINLGRARKVKSDPLATKAQRDWADAILKKYNEKP